MRHTRREPGFTFIEMMVVIFVIGLMSALVVTNLDGITARSALSQEGRDLGNRLLFLRDLAIVQGREMTLEIDVENQRWRDIDRPGRNEVPDEDDREELTFYGPWFELRHGIVLEEIAFGRTAELDDLITITISPKGEMFPSGFVAYLMHENMAAEDGLSVEVSGLTGTVSYHRGHVEAEEIREEHDF